MKKLLKIISMILFLFSMILIPVSAIWLRVHDELNAPRLDAIVDTMGAQTLSQELQYAKEIAQFAREIAHFKSQIEWMAQMVKKPEFLWASMRNRTLAELNSRDNTYHDTEYWESKINDKKQVVSTRKIAINDQTKTNEESKKVLKDQIESIQITERKIEQLRQKAETAEGELEAVGYSNQYLNELNDQMIDIKALLISMHQMQLSQSQKIANKEAQEMAFLESYTDPENKSYKKYGLNP